MYIIPYKSQAITVHAFPTPHQRSDHSGFACMSLTCDLDVDCVVDALVGLDLRPGFDVRVTSLCMLVVSLNVRSVCAYRVDEDGFL